MQRIKKIGKILGYAILLCLVGLCILTFIQTDIMKKRYSNVFGYTYFTVASGSMSGTAEVGDVIFVRLTKDIKPGEVVTYLDSNKDIVTHRLIEVKNDKYYAKGDVNDSIDDAISKRDIIGKVVFIISPKFALEVLILIIIIVIVLALFNFDKLFEKFAKEEIKKKDSKQDNSNIPEDVFVNPKNKDEKTGLTVTISIDEVMKIKELQEEDVEILDEDVPIIDVVKDDIVNTKYDTLKKKEEEIYELVTNLLRVKNNSISTSRIRKEWLNKLKYVYKLTLMLDNNIDIADEIKNPTFSEVYDYDLDRVGLYGNLRNKIYSAHIYVYLKILVYSIVYNDLEYFDAIYKIMKYKILIDENNNFKALNDSYSKKEIKTVINLIKNISNKYDNKNSFELEKIERLVKIKNYK